MAKINLLTLHYADNNGSALQAYATCKILKDLGHEVTVINLQNKQNVIGRLKHVKNWILIPRYLKFHWFQNRYLSPMTERMFEIETSKLPPCDYTIVGSDQVWNADFEVVKKGTYFLNFVNDGSKKIALASSFGKKEWEADNDFTQKVKSWLQDFTAISVREDSGVDICRKIFEVNAVNVIDPTLALGDFSELVDIKPHLTNEIRCFLFKKGYSLEVLNYISHKENLPVRNASRKKLLKKLPNWNSSPIKWMEMIRDSKIWVSDSFHGVAFAIIFQKQFVALVNDKKKLERIQSLLKLLQLEEKLVFSLEDLKERYVEVMAQIDYSQVYKRLRKEQDVFKSFVRENIL